MRIIRVNEDESSTHTALWVAAGVVAGLVTGVVVAERMSGRRMSARGIWRRTRDLAGRAVDRWEPLLDAAMQVRDAWAAPGNDEEDEEREEIDEELDDDLDEDLDDEQDEEDEDDEDDEGEEEEEDDEEEEEEDATLEADGVDERVLVAFTNDPILAEREIEIEATDEGGILLHGSVRTSAEVARAVTIARGVPGVAGVRQRLRVRDRR